jgi:hypothetical protein
MRGSLPASQIIDKEGQKQYHMGIEFLDLTEKDRKVLASFIDQGAITDTGCVASRQELPQAC